MSSNFHSFPSIDLNDDIDVNYAVRVQNVSFGYKKKTTVLKKFSVRIAQGGIFALLGSNGCGKTTLLKLILGRIKPKSGWIRIYGLTPGHEKSDIPGPGVGYMPQDIALFTDFTIKECLNYFGNIYKINRAMLDHRTELIAELLSLPPMNRKLSELSGGQQRLVSMAVTIIHRPKLLILDEPTVGVDSILRCRIWSYLENICNNYGTTVLITTHYIEEAKAARSIGFISTGVLLKQSNPSELLEEYNCTSLEKVFLILCETHYSKLREDRKHANVVLEEESCPEPENQLLVDINDSYHNNGLDIQRIGALITKTLIRLKRSEFTISLFFLLPLITLIIFKQTVGTKPRHIPIAIYTGDDPNNKHIARKLVNQFNPDHLIYHFYDNEEAAIESVVKAKNMYALSLPVNYSSSLYQRLPNPFKVDDETIDNSIIRIYVDHSDPIVTIFVRYTYLIDSVVEYVKKLGLELGLNPVAFERPIDTSQPIFAGSFLESETYPSAGILIFFIYIMSISLSAMLIIIDLKSKSLERLYVSGVKPIEVFLVHTIEMFALIAIQVFFVTLLMFYLFDIPMDRSFVEAFTLVFLHGIEGAGTGLLIALIFKDEIHVFIIIVGLVIPLMTSSGVMWPLEAIPQGFRLIIEWTPIALPLDSLRSILFRRLSISEARVMIGFIICISYNVIIYSLNLILVTILKDFDFPNFFQLNFRG